MQVASHTSSLPTINTGVYTHDCVATSDSSTIIKCHQDTVVEGLISDNIEKAYPEEVTHLENSCQENNLSMNISKTKELIAEFGRKQERNYQPHKIDGALVERVESFRCLGICITEDLSWSSHVSNCQHLWHFRDFRLPLKVLKTF